MLQAPGLDVLNLHRVIAVAIGCEPDSRISFDCIQPFGDRPPVRIERDQPGRQR
jgi:hypothetical protein